MAKNKIQFDWGAVKQRVLVLAGGNSPEREVSLRSGAAVQDALVQAGFETEMLDIEHGLKPDLTAPDTIVFPILHGAGGEDGAIQAELESLKLPFLGSDSQASKMCFDKSLTRRCLLENDIPVPRGATVSRAEYALHPLSQQPHILKVVRGGSSIGTLFVRDPDAATQSQVDEVFELDNQAILEELVEGVEITVPILDTVALPVVEIKPPADGEFDYENKYNGQTVELCPPKNVAAESQHQAQQMAEKVHKVTGSRDLSRVDIIVRPDESLVVLEINTMPGMTIQSLYPKSAFVAGIGMPELVTRFVEIVKRRGES